MILKKIVFLVLLMVLAGSFLIAQNQANVLIDKATATWCVYCPGAATIFADLETQYGTRVPAIAWHPTSDPFGTSFTNYWANLVGPEGYPTMNADHVYETVGAGSAFKTQVSNRMGVSRALFMSVAAGQSSAIITMRNDSAAAISGNLLAVVVERHIRYNWQGVSVLDFVARLNCFTANTGEAVNIPAGQSILKTVNYNLNSITYPSGAQPATGGALFEIVAFVYNPGNLDAYQAAKGVVGMCNLTAGFSYSTSSSSLTVNFTDTSTDDCHAITGWNWSFGDGTSATVKNPVKTYAAAGNYSVKLVVTNSIGSTSETTKSFFVGPQAPVADFSYTTADTVAIFTDKSTDNGAITKWQWQFLKNGAIAGSSTMQHPSFDYGEFGTFQAKLTVTDNETPGQTGTVTKNVEISQCSDYCASKGTTTSYEWIEKITLDTYSKTSGANGGYADFTAETIELKKGNSYPISLTPAYSGALYEENFVVWIDFNKNCVFDDNEKVFNPPATTTMVTGTIAIPATAVTGKTRMRISMKDQTGVPTACETFTYGEVEDYSVNLTSDCPTPIASFTYQSLGNYQIQFTDTSTAGSTATLVSWKWGFGEAPYLGTSTLQHPQFTFPAHGFYPCCLDVTNHCGKTAGICMAVEVPQVSTDQEDIIGVFPSVGGLWKVENTGSSFNWTRLSLQEPDSIRMADVDGNGLDDLGCLFKATQKFWIRYDNGNWMEVPASAKDMICFDLGDINKDGKADIVGSWTFGTWWKNTATGVWAKLSTMSPTYLAAGDFDGDGYCDMVGLYPTLASLWIYRFNGSPEWKQISKQINLNDLRTGDFDNDGKAEVLGSWNIGTWTFNPTINIWVKHSSNQASVLCSGDINGLGKDDIIGDWSPNVSGTWLKTLENGIWAQISKQVPTDLTSGKTK